MRGSDKLQQVVPAGGALFVPEALPAQSVGRTGGTRRGDLRIPIA